MKRNTVVTWKVVRWEGAASYSNVGVATGIDGNDGKAIIIKGALDVDKANANPNDYEWVGVGTDALTEVAPSVVRMLRIP